MEFDTKFYEIEKICEIHVTGKVIRPKDSIVIQELARDIEEKQGYQRFLIDMTQTEIISGIMDTYETAVVPLDSDKKQVNQRIALLYADEISDHKYMESVSLKRGYKLRIFYKMDEAFEWLRNYK